jgi:hypothetical protein
MGEAYSYRTRLEIALAGAIGVATRAGNKTSTTVGVFRPKGTKPVSCLAPSRIGTHDSQKCSLGML